MISDLSTSNRCHSSKSGSHAPTLNKHRETLNNRRGMAKNIASVWEKKVYKLTAYEKRLIKQRNFRSIVDDSTGSFRPISSALKRASLVKNSFPEIIEPKNKKEELPSKTVPTNKEKTNQQPPEHNISLLLIR